MRVLVRWLWLGTLLLVPFGAGAGSYFHYHPETGSPLQWEPDSDSRVRIFYTVDAGGLGRLTHDQAVSLLEMAMRVWEAIANVEFIPDPDLPITPEAITVENYNDYLVEHTICDDDYAEEEVENPLQWQRKSVLGFDNSGGDISNSIDGISGEGTAIGLTHLNCIQGTTDHPEFISAVQITLNGAYLNGDSHDGFRDITINRYFGVILHELGHFLGLDHASTHQALAQAIDEGELDKEQYARYLSTMAILLAQHEDRATLNPDDIAAIQALYPLPDSPTSTVSGTITDASGIPFRGANLELRNIDDPLCEVFSFVSGKECTPLKISENGSIFYGGSVCGSSSPNTGDFLFRAIPSGRYILEVSEVLDEYKGGVIHPFPNDDRAIPELPGLAEFYNENDQASEDPYTYSIIEVGPDTHVSGIAVTLSDTVPDGDGVENVIPYTYYLDNPELFGDSLNNPNTRCKPNTTDYAAAIGVEELVEVSTTPPPETPSSSSSDSGGSGCSLGQAW